MDSPHYYRVLHYIVTAHLNNLNLHMRKIEVSREGPACRLTPHTFRFFPCGDGSPEPVSKLELRAAYLQLRRGDRQVAPTNGGYVFALRSFEGVRRRGLPR